MHVESVCNHRGAWKQSKPVHYPLTLLTQVLMQRLPLLSCLSMICTQTTIYKYAMQTFFCHYSLIFALAVYTEQSKRHQLNTVFLHPGLQKQQNVYYITLLYKILIFTEEALEPKGYFQ